MPKASLSRDRRNKLLSKLRAGHALESATADLGITKSQIAAGGDKLTHDIAEAFRAGTAKLRGRLMEGALETDNATVLLRLLEKREEAQTRMFGEDDISRIERVIVASKCPHCGEAITGDASEATSDLEVARRMAFLISKGDPKHRPEPPTPKANYGEERNPEPASASSSELDMPDPKTPPARQRYKRYYPNEFVLIDGEENENA